MRLRLEPIKPQGGSDINYWDHGHAQTIALPYTFKLYKYLLHGGDLK